MALNDNLLYASHFSGNANDWSGNGNDGTLQGNTTGTTDKNGNSNSALTFDGSSDYVGLPQININGGFGVSFWLNTSVNADNYDGLVTNDAANNTEPYFQIVLAGDKNGELRFEILDGNSDKVVIDSNQSLTDGNWHHVVVTFPSNAGRSDISVYIDNSVASMSLNTNYTSNSSADNWTYAGIDKPIYVAAERTLSAFLNGVMDEVRIYDRELSSSEVNTLYNIYDRETPVDNTLFQFGGL